jgi:hypothetical protein
MPGSNRSRVVEANDLKPRNVSDFRYTGDTLPGPVRPSAGTRSRGAPPQPRQPKPPAPSRR